MGELSVVVTDDRFGDYGVERAVFKDSGIDVTVLGECGEEELAGALEGAHGILVNQRRLDSGIIAAMKRCAVISRYGSGYDNVDVPAATERGIWVARVPDYCQDEVAEHALALILSCQRRLGLTDRAVRAGRWNVHPSLKTRRLAGCTLGIVGYGWTGRSLARKVSGLGLTKVLLCDHHLDPSDPLGPLTEAAPLERLLREADVVSLHVPMRDENRHLIGEEELALMKEGSILVNTSRGALVDEQALVAALRARRIGFAGVDVFEREPPAPVMSELLALDNVVLSDHCAYYSEESLVELKTKAAQNVLEVLLGGEPRYAVNRIASGRPSGKLRRQGTSKTEYALPSGE